MNRLTSYLRLTRCDALKNETGHEPKDHLHFMQLSVDRARLVQITKASASYDMYVASSTSRRCSYFMFFGIL